MFEQLWHWIRSLVPRGREPDAVLGKGLDLDGLPTIADEDTTASLRHDRYLYG